MKLITAKKYEPDHGAWYDPIVNPQVRGWYGSRHLNKDTDIAKWNPYASLRIDGHDHDDDDFNEKVQGYGKEQRNSGKHLGLDIYAPVGTPIHACVDGIVKKHEYKKVISKDSAGFSTHVSGTKKYKEKSVYLVYIHLMEFEETRFRFYRHTKGNKKKGTFKVLNEGWLNYADYSTLKEYTDTKMGEVYKIHYSNGILTIDGNEIDVDLAKSIVVDKEVKKGDIIGFTGSTGNSYQGKKMNHLHFGVSLAGVPQHPYETLKEYIGLDASGETNTKQDGATRSSEW